MENYELIINFFKGIGAEREANDYLKLFKKGNPARFAVIKVGGRILEQNLSMLALDLAFLSNLDLFPVVIHGGGPQIDVELQKHGIEFRKKDGIRVTPPAAIPVLKTVLDKANRELVDRIHADGGTAVGLTEGIFTAEKHPDPDLGYVGVVKGVNLEPIFKAIRKDQVPIVSPLGFDAKGQAYNINADTAARAMVLALKPKKYILITEEGGIRGATGRIISTINCANDYDYLIKSGIVYGGMLLKLTEAKTLLEQIGAPMVVEITSPEKLLKELFTVQGGGTFIKLGSEVRAHKDFRKLSTQRLRGLIESSFARKLVKGYFGKPPHAVILEENYQGVAVLRKVQTMFYLDKFAVHEGAQGEGIGSDIWEIIEKEYPRVFWRARPENPVNPWYFKHCDGVRKFDRWYVYWMGLNEKQIKQAIAYALEQPETMIPHPGKTASTAP
jgi:acetylglutamate kinase